MSDTPSWWPAEAERTSPDNRERDRFGVNLQKAEHELVKDLERIDATDIRVDREMGSRATFPGVVVRWHRNGKPYALACDTYRKRAQNMRACGLTIKKLRHVREYGAVTTSEAYQGLEQLPPTVEQGRTIQLGAGDSPPGSKDPYQVLDLEPGATVDEVKAAARALKIRYHPDKPGGDEAKFKRINDAEHQLLGGGDHS